MLALFFIIGSLLFILGLFRLANNKKQSHTKSINIFQHAPSPPYTDELYGEEEKSPNGQYTVAAEDGYGNHPGKLRLLENGKPLSTKKLERPNDAHVSNNGTIICCDWLHTNELTGKLLVFDSQGQLLFSKKTTANLGNSAISDNGRYAIFETYGSDTVQSNQIFIIDIVAGQLLGHFDRPFVFRSATINEQPQQIRFKNNQGFIFETDFSGRQTNRESYEADIRQRGSILDQLGLYDFRCDETKFNDPTYLVLLEKALNDKNASYRLGADRIYRRMGEYFENNGIEQEAIVTYQKALEINPKVGVTRKLEALKKKHK